MDFAGKVKMDDVWDHLRQSWIVALTNPYYILAWQILLLLIVYES